MKKPDFTEINYDPKTFCWGKGNHAVGPRLLASIQLREMTKSEDAKMKKDWEDAKAIYDKYINRGQRFRPGGDRGHRHIECIITFINSDKQSVTWKQDNLSKKDEAYGFKPAAGKFSINAMIKLYRSKEIEFI